MKIQLINFLINLKNASILNKKFVLIKFNVQNIKMIKCLYEENYILSFHYLNSIKSIKLFFNSCYSINFFKTLKIMTTGSHSTYIKYIDLCRLIIKHKLLILSTTKGFVTGDFCKRYRLGGKLLFIS